MCGIVAIVSERDPIELGALRAATAALRHRGPDDERTWVSPDGRVGLGHVLLNIATADGTQPIASEDGQVVIVANGEFYDDLALRERLIAGGHRFRTSTDSEIALHLYEDLGAECLRDLRGEFAFVIWDGRSHRIFAARDRFGVKPLYYTRLNDTIVFASEVKALVAAGYVPSWDDSEVYGQIFGAFHPERTLFRDVRQVPASHVVSGTPTALHRHRYWDVDFPRSGQEIEIDFAESVEETHRLLVDAVTLRQRAHVPVGFLVSGGIDSSAVMAIGAAHSPTPVCAFTIAFDGEQYDESEKASIAARHAGAELTVVRVHEVDLADQFAASVRAGEAIQVNAHGTARFLLSRAIQQAGYRAVMAGEGADEIFAGYAFLRPAIGGAPLSPGQRVRRIARIVGRLDGSERRVASVSPKLARLSRTVALPDTLLTRYAGGIALWESVLAPDFLREARARDPYWSLLRSLDWRGQLLGRAPARQILYLWFRSVFANYHLAADRMDMAHAVEVRLPFLDHPLVEFATRVPLALQARGGVNKSLLRAATSRYLPEVITAGRKQPFYAPPATLKQGGRLNQLVRDTLASESGRNQTLFDRDAVLRIMDGTAMTDVERTMLDPLLMVVTSLTLLDAQMAAARRS